MKPSFTFLFLISGTGDHSLMLMRSILTRSSFSFISLAPSIGNYELIISQTIVLLPIKLLSLDGYTGTTSRSCGDGSTDPSSNSKCTRANKAEWRVEVPSLPRGLAMRRIINAAVADITKRLVALKIVREKMQPNIQGSPYMTTITWWRA